MKFNKKIAALLLAALMIIMALPVGVAAEQVACFELIDSVEGLTSGDKVLIVAEYDGEFYALGKQSLYWRESVAVTEKDGKIYADTATAVADTTPYELTVGIENGVLSFYDGVGGGYLQSAHAKYSRLTLSAALTDAGRFLPSFDGGTLSLKTLDGTVLPAMGYNSDNGRFICFAEDAAYISVSVYKYIGNADKPEDSSKEELYACYPIGIYANYHTAEELLEVRSAYIGTFLENITYMITLTDARGVGIATKNVTGSAFKSIDCLLFSFSIANEVLAEHSPFFITVSSKTANAIRPISTHVTFTDEPPIYNVYFNTPYGESYKQEVKRGEDAVPPTPVEQHNLNFVGWDGDYTNVTEDRVLTAIYEDKLFTVIFLDRDGNELKRETVTYWGNVTPPTAPELYGYTFSGWDGNYTMVESDLTLTAVYTPKKYMVKFVDANGSMLLNTLVPYGEDAVPPEVTVPNGYSFDGWEGDYTNITEDRTIQAKFSKLSYTLTFVAGDGGRLEGDTTITAEYGTMIMQLELPTPVPEDGYLFGGWKLDTIYVSGNMTVTAVFDKNYIAGDVDLNGEVNAADAALALKHDVALLTLEGQAFSCAEITGDEIVDSFDAYYILMRDVALVDAFPS